MRKSIARIIAAVLVLMSILNGCGKVNNSNADGGQKEIVVTLNSETGSLDPAGSIALTFLAYSASALDELLTFDEEGEIEYRAAVSYEVNEELTEWTFYLREDAKWSNGSKVTAEDFIYTIERALQPESGSGYANYLFPIKNAEAIYQGEMPMSELGVTAKDELTLVFSLAGPCVYFLDLLRLPVYLPTCRNMAEVTDAGWAKNPDTSAANGPFYLAEYVPEQYFILAKNDYYWDAGRVHLDQITYRFFDSQLTMAAAYETGEVDVAVNLQSAVMELYQGKEDLVVTDAIATRYIYPNLNEAVFQDVRVRKALSLAVERDELCKMAGGDTEPTRNFVAKHMIDKETGRTYTEGWGDSFEENIEEAKALLAEAGYPDGDGFPKITYSYPTLELDSDTAQILKEQWKRNLNIDVELKAQELQVNYASRRAGDFELCRMNWTADFADPATYLTMLLSNGTYNTSGVDDDRYDRLVERAGSETDPAARSRIMAEAEKLAAGEQFYVIPLFSMRNCNLIRPEIVNVKKIPASGALDYRYADIKE